MKRTILVLALALVSCVELDVAKLARRNVVSHVT
jgi:hypothetical protein